MTRATPPRIAAMLLPATAEASAGGESDALKADGRKLTDHAGFCRRVTG